MNLYGYEILCEDDLMHHGIKGQRWGVRRFQNEDGTWTAAGKNRYGDETSSSRKSVLSAKNDIKTAKAAYKQAKKEFQNSPEQKAKRAENLKKAVKIGAALAGTALVAYGAYQLYQNGVNIKNAEKAAKEAEYIRQQSEIGRRLYNETLKKMMNSDNVKGGSYTVRLADGNILSTEWGPKKN